MRQYPFSSFWSLPPQSTRLQRSAILLPLFVMLLLTCLIGGTSFQVSSTWEKSLNEVRHSLGRALILNNLRWKLVSVEKKLSQTPNTALADWRALQSEFRLLSQTETDPNLKAEFLILSTSPLDAQRLRALLRRADTINSRLDQASLKLKALQQYSQSVTVLTTASLVFLGLVLTGVTARDLSRLFHQLGESREKLISVQEEERQRIAQELHDGVIQELVSLKRNYSPQAIDQLVGNIRRICRNLKPQVLEDLGLAGAIELLAEELAQDARCDISLHLESANLGQLPKPYELPLFRVIQELVNNIRQHACASQVKITLLFDPQESPLLRLYVQDNGTGFTPEAVKPGLGLTGIRERVAKMGGTFKIETGLSHNGSLFRILIPVIQPQPRGRWPWLTIHKQPSL